MTLILRQSTAIDIRMGPFVDATDGVTPETGITLGTADQAEVLKADGAATVAMGGTFAAITGADGWYDYTVATGDVDTVGEVVFVVQDLSVSLPVYVRGYVVEEEVYDAMYAAAAAGPLQSTTAGRTLDVTATGAAGIDWANVENPGTTVDLSATDINLADTVTTLTGHTAQTGDNFARLGAPAGASVSADVAAVQADTDNIQTRLPAALVGGAMDSDVSGMQANVVTAAAIATDAIDADALAADAVDEIRDGLLPTQNATFNNIPVLFVSSSDHVTPVTGATGTAVTRSIDGAAFAAGTGTFAEVANGMYQYDASAADMNGGVIVFRFTATGGTPAAPDDTFVPIVTGGGV